MADEKKTTEGAKAARAKRRLPKVGKKVAALLAETREAYAAAGKELSREKGEEIVLGPLEHVWPRYLVKELAEFCRLPELGGYEIVDDDDDEDDEEEVGD
jgi:hypothetical protein